MDSTSSPSPRTPLSIFPAPTSQTSTTGTTSSVSHVVYSLSSPLTRRNDALLVKSEPSVRLPSYDSIVSGASAHQVDGSESGTSFESMQPHFEPARNSIASGMLFTLFEFWSYVA
ncbi:unnamed protein product [Dibothriocephalus latus]|uniref:Uncharacterized protein n=1 Tax=Dibothriocephalus latus TaxID=60516 RepID=A0A3P7PFC4_DIBLA|nr:unnamed protein product [Dibothriocephalus latus]